MSLLDKAKQLTNEAQESASKLSSVELIANTIIIAGEKMEATNALLQDKGANHRVSGISVSMGVPPTVSFGVCRIGDEK